MEQVMMSSNHHYRFERYLESNLQDGKFKCEWSLWRNGDGI